MSDLSLVSSEDLLTELQRRHTCVMAFSLHDETGPKSRYITNGNIVEAYGLLAMLGRHLHKQAQLADQEAP